ncbi:DNA cytosine methyltransferase [Synechocystis sp. LEGE 06083]|nr:DNA cytosine methyltransferase [Synechocystis sp. LEGE 06083]MBE9193806.1 DNA cytosine methyltransferase [Synechocystis sp. LEGE 06083]
MLGDRQITNIALKLTKLSTARSSSHGKLKHLDLFAGCGGFTLAAEQTGGKIQTTQFVEIDPDCHTILQHHWPHIPIHADIRDYYPTPGQFDLVTAGFPCTGTSEAGTKTGLHHPQSALFRQVLRIVAHCHPPFVVIEQPLGVIHRGLRAVLGGLRMVGYQSEVEIISAAELGAGHRRERLFVISYPHGLFGHLPPSWVEQIGAMVEAQRVNCQWLTVKRHGLCPDSGLSFSLVSTPGPQSCTVPTGTPGRIKARKLAGRTVTPGQAACGFSRALGIALNRVLYLHSML